MALFQAILDQSGLRLAQWLTFDIQDQSGGGAVADEALGGDAPQVVLPLRTESHPAAGDGDAAAGRQEALLQHLEDTTFTP